MHIGIILINLNFVSAIRSASQYIIWCTLNFPSNTSRYKRQSLTQVHKTSSKNIIQIASVTLTTYGKTCIIYEQYYTNITCINYSNELELWNSDQEHIPIYHMRYNKNFPRILRDIKGKSWPKCTKHHPRILS